MINYFPHLPAAIHATRHFLLRYGQVVKPAKWQGKENDKLFFSALNWSFTFNLPKYPGPLIKFRDIPGINIEWCDAQFNERVGGLPLNPGESYKIWPFYKNNKANDKFRTEGEKFTHTYMERFWPKTAGDWLDDGQRKSAGEDILKLAEQYKAILPSGIRFYPGDFKDVINLLSKEPDTRQAFLPIWFPEDTGVVHGGRVPCTLGYLFQIRNNELHITYYIRACDYFRHFRDDIYLAARLVYYLINSVPELENVHPGNFTMHIADLHIFASEIKLLQNEG